MDSLAAAPPQQRQSQRRYARVVERILIISISFVILSLLKLEPLARDSEQDYNSEIDQPSHRKDDLPDNLRALQELTTGKKYKSEDNGSKVGDDTGRCPPPLKLYENRIVAPSYNSNTTTRHAIPRILHLSERSRCLNRDMYDAIQIWQNNFPTFSIFFHDDAAVDRLLFSEKGEYSDWRVNFSDIVKILPCVSPGAMKIDIWRVLVLWKYGGMYFDADIIPAMLTEKTLHPGSTWFSLSDSWDRPSQWMFAASAQHMSCKNALHIIANNVFNVPNIQQTKLVFVTGPHALYWGVKDSLRNETDNNAESVFVSVPPLAADHITGPLVKFKDGSWGQWVTQKSRIQWVNYSYWEEMVPFDETKCIPRKSRSQKHFGRVHWLTARSSGLSGLPLLSCKKHLEKLPLNEQEELGTTAKDVPSPSNGNREPSSSSAELILKNSNNATMCAYLANETVLKKEQ